MLAHAEPSRSLPISEITVIANAVKQSPVSLFFLTGNMLRAKREIASSLPLLAMTAIF
jgi:hypothetical protein